MQLIFTTEWNQEESILNWLLPIFFFDFGATDISATSMQLHGQLTALWCFLDGNFLIQIHTYYSSPKQPWQIVSKWQLTFTCLSRQQLPFHFNITPPKGNVICQKVCTFSSQISMGLRSNETCPHHINDTKIEWVRGKDLGNYFKRHQHHFC